ncbi:MAG: pyridoxal phosphate-dependent aminotransferase [Bacteroidota bacterium]
MKGTNLLQKLSESQTLAITKKVRQLRKEGRDITGLTLGEPDFDTPDHIRNAAIEAIREGFTHYPPVAGIPDLRQAIADKFRTQNGLDLGPKNVVVSTGAKQSIVNVIMSLINPGDEVIMGAPYWVSYLEMLKMADAKTVTIQTSITNRFKITPSLLEAAITPKTKMLILNSPNNPTGSMYTKQELTELVAVLAKHPHVFVLADEIYEHIAYDETPTSAASFPEIADRTIIVNGVSKGFAMTGWRIGYIGAPVWIAELCEKYQGQITSGASSISQRAALAALTGPMDPTYAMREEFRRRRDWMANELEIMPEVASYVPTGAFYFYPDLSVFFGRTAPSGRKIADIDVLCDYLIMEGGVALIPGTAFGTDAHVRISYAYAMETLQSGMERLGNALAALK